MSGNDLAVLWDVPFYGQVPFQPQVAIDFGGRPGGALGIGGDHGPVTGLAGGLGAVGGDGQIGGVEAAILGADGGCLPCAAGDEKG